MQNTISANGINLSYFEDGHGAETVVFSHGFMLSRQMYEHQQSVLSQSYRTLAYDQRSHGDSELVRGDFDVYDLTEDAAEFIRKTNSGPVHFAGLSAGGFVGLRLALRYPELIKSLVLLDTTARAETPKSYKAISRALSLMGLFGLRPFASTLTKQIMGKTFLQNPERNDEKVYWKRYIGSLNGRAMKSFGQAIFQRDDLLSEIEKAVKFPPTLILVGEEDEATPPADAQAMHERISGSVLNIIPKAGHFSPVEEPELVTEAISKFLMSV